MTAIRLPLPALRREGAIPESPDYWTQLAWLTAGASPLLAWRRAARLSVVDLAQASGMDAEVIVAIEARGHRATQAELAALAGALGLCPGDLED